MNGFGPIHVPPSPSEGEDTCITKSRELNAYLKSFTSAEEVAICQIALLVTITRLKQGNIMGITSCAHVHSKMASLLSNLPCKCNFIILTRKNKADTGLASTKFRQDRIQRAPKLLKNTHCPA
jgi:hypothetical protein